MSNILFQSNVLVTGDLAALCPIVPEKMTTNALHSANEAKQIVFCLDKGQTLNDHQTPNTAIVLVLSGTMTVNIDHETFTLREQHVLVIPPRKTHAVYAIEPTRFLLTLVKEPNE